MPFLIPYYNIWMRLGKAFSEKKIFFSLVFALTFHYLLIR